MVDEDPENVITFRQTRHGPKTDYNTKAVYSVREGGRHRGYVISHQDSSKTGSLWTSHTPGGQHISASATRRDAAEDVISKYHRSKWKDARGS